MFQISTAPRRSVGRAAWLALALLGGSCAEGNSPSAAAGPRTAAPQSAVGVPPPPEVPPVSPAQATFYQQAFSQAERFEPKKIPPEMLRSLDQGNDTYVKVRGPNNQLLGYLRDIQAPVTLAAGCECAPLNLTLVFNPDFTFRTLISAAPLTKHGHTPMTQEDVQRLVEIAKDPPKELRRVLDPEDIVDAETGATKRAHQEHVVPMAGLSTHRVVGLVRDTQRILQGAPASWDQRRLQEVLRAAGEDHLLRARYLAELLPTVETPSMGREAHHLMARSYLLALEQGAAPAAQVEALLLEAGLGPEVDALEALEACYELATRKLRLALAQRCVDTYRHSPHVAAADLARLEGTLRYQAGEAQAAVELLQRAAADFGVEIDPELHVRLGESLAASGQGPQACEVATSLLFHHPRLPAVESLLKQCGDPAQVKQQTYQALHQRLLQRERTTGDPVPVLPLETHNAEPLDLVLADPHRVTVAVFFATWCPHCRAEMPAIVQFAQQVASGPWAQKVRVVGIRTAVEKESEPYATFEQTFAPTFPVYTDPVMALAFSKFAKSQDLSPSIPVVAVIDQHARVRHILESGDYRDTAQELIWAVQHVLNNPGTPEQLDTQGDASPQAPQTTQPADEAS